MQEGHAASTLISPIPKGKQSKGKGKANDDEIPNTAIVASSDEGLITSYGQQTLLDPFEDDGEQQMHWAGDPKSVLNIFICFLSLLDIEKKTISLYTPIHKQEAAHTEKEAEEEQQVRDGSNAVSLTAGVPATKPKKSNIPTDPIARYA